MRIPQIHQQNVFFIRFSYILKLRRTKSFYLKTDADHLEPLRFSLLRNHRTSWQHFSHPGKQKGPFRVMWYHWGGVMSRFFHTKGRNMRPRGRKNGFQNLLRNIKCCYCSTKWCFMTLLPVGVSFLIFSKIRTVLNG